MLSHHSLKCTHPVEHYHQDTWGYPKATWCATTAEWEYADSVRHQAYSEGSTPSLPVRHPSSFSLIRPLAARAASEPWSQHSRGSRDDALSGCSLWGSSSLQNWKLDLFQFELLLLLLWAAALGFKTQDGFFHLFTCLGFLSLSLIHLVKS